MAKVGQYRTKDQVQKDELKKHICEAIDSGLIVVVIVHQDEANTTDLFTNRNFDQDRLGLKGLVAEAQEALTLAAPIPYGGSETID